MANEPWGDFLLVTFKKTYFSLVLSLISIFLIKFVSQN